MPVDETKCCEGHTKKKVESGECCQIEDQENAEALTYEQTFINKVHSMVYMDKTKEKHE